MITEEKAKKYDEALEWMRKIYPGLTDAAKEDAEHYFPELKESEDERIRKAIIELLKEIGRDDTGISENVKCMIAYLEKQKEQKPAEWNYPYGVNETADRLFAIAECLEMDGDCLFNGYSGTECGKFLRELARKQVEYKPAAWSEEDETCLEYALWCVMKTRHFVAKDACDLDACRSAERWLKSLPERFNLQPQAKQEQPEPKDEVKLTRWVARDENGEIYAFEDYPEKDSEMWIGSNSMLLDRKSFPDLKWEDEPMEVEITIRKK